VSTGRNPNGRHFKEHEAHLYKSAEKNLTPDKRKRLYSEVFGSQVRAPKSRAKYDDFYHITPILDKAVSGEPDSMPVELLRNKGIVILSIVLISRRADLETLQPYLLTSQNRSYVRFLDKVGSGKPLCDWSSTVIFCRISQTGVLPRVCFFCIQANQKCSGAPRS